MSKLLEKTEYDISELRRNQSVCELGRECAALHHVFGADLSRRGNLAFIARGVLIYVTGNAVIFEDIYLHTKRYLLGLDDEGVGCVAVHPSRNMFAVGGKGFKSNIYIYTYPELNTIRVLSDGAERGYTSLSFNHHGNKLASVSSAPDYMLTVWDWDEEKIALHSKAFGQDVFTVRFSQDDDKRLTTSGTGHIRFWKMAATFTGLKLQGNIGKFGKVELSDVAAFCELPDGKVVSGTESGALLLWEGNFIKCRFVMKNDALCHEGEITSVEIDRDDRCLITAGSDGFIRWWDLYIVDSAEVDSDNSMDFELAPMAEYSINGTTKVLHTVEEVDGEMVAVSHADPNQEKHKGIKAIVDGRKFDNERCYVILDSLGVLTSISFEVVEGVRGIPEDALVSDLSYSHAGSITGMDTCPSSHVAMTCGSDGTVRCWNYLDRKFIGMMSFPFAATCLRWAPVELDRSGISVVVGFDDGCVRLLTFTGSKDYTDDECFSLTMVIKPHRVPVVDFAFSKDGALLATSGRDGTVFFFDCRQMTDYHTWTPIRFVTLEDANGEKGKVICDKIHWHDNCMRILCTCSDGMLREIDIENLLATVDLSNTSLKTFEYPIPVKIAKFISTAIGIPKPSEEEDDDDLGDIDEEGNPINKTPPPAPIPTVPAKIISGIYFTRNNLEPPSHALVGAVAGQTSQIFEVDLDKEVPLREHKLGLHSFDGKTNAKAPQMRCIRYSQSKKFIVTGSNTGGVLIRPARCVETFISLMAHNEANGGTNVVAASFDDNFVISAGFDGLLVVYRINPAQLLVTGKTLLDELQISSTGFDGIKRPILRKTISDPPVEPKFLSIVSAHTMLDGFYDIEDITTIPDHRIPPEFTMTDLPVTAYCIEDEKLKSEEDVKKDGADRKKRKVRTVIAALQKEFEHLMAMNHRLPKAVQLPRDSMLVDGDYFTKLKQESEERLIEVRKECAYEAERAEKLRMKLRNRLMEDIMVEEIALKGFRTRRPIIVHSLRTRGMDSSLKALVDSVHASVKSDLLADVRNQLNASVSQRRSNAAGALDGISDVGFRQSLDGSGTAGGNAAARREQRKLRQAKIQSHAMQKPNEDEDDERDIRAIHMAELCLGVYKLKCAGDYEVPENQRVNAEKKRRQMVLLEENMITMRLRFNDRFLSMRQLKKQLIESIRSNNSRIREIDMELGVEDTQDIIWEPVLDPAEFPDDRDEVAENELLEYREIRSKISWVNAQAPLNKTVTGVKTLIKIDAETGNYYVQSGANTHAPSTIKISAHEAISDEDMSQKINDCVLSNFTMNADRTNTVKDILELERCIPVLQYAKQSLSRVATNVNAGNSEARSALERHRRLEYEKKILLQKTEDNVKSFDLALDELRQERHEVTADLKLAELKLIVLYQEYVLLLTFEGRDNALQQKQLRCEREKSEVKGNLQECQNKVDSKLEDMKEYNEKLKGIYAELSVLVPDNHPFSDTLSKIFKKKMKRNRKGDDNQDDDDDDEDSDDDDDEAEEEEIDDNCPLGCEVSLFDKTLDLREKRLDQEESLTETQRAVDDLKKTMDRLKQREKQIDKDARQTESEIKQFHLQKQSALNVIDIVVPIRISQLYAFQLSGKISGPSDKPLTEPEEYDMNKLRNELRDAETRTLYPQMTIDTHVLFKKEALDKLYRRIGELHRETEDIRTDLHTLHKERVRLEKDREVQREEIDRWTERINECQMLKFGRLVDLDDLDQEADRTKEDDAAKTIKKIESKHDSLSNKLQTEKDRLKDEIAAATRKNTELLREVATLAETKLSVTRDLNSSTEVRSQQDSKQNMVQETEERKRIASYVKLQAKELASLKNEITLLKRKDPIPMSAVTMSASLPAPPTSVDVMLAESKMKPNSPATNMFPPIPVKSNSGTFSTPSLSSSQKRVEVNLRSAGGR